MGHCTFFATVSPVAGIILALGGKLDSNRAAGRRYPGPPGRPLQQGRPDWQQRSTDWQQRRCGSVAQNLEFWTDFLSDFLLTVLTVTPDFGLLAAPCCSQPFLQRSSQLIEKQQKPSEKWGFLNLALAIEDSTQEASG
jgi:hypothetical protein